MRVLSFFGAILVVWTALPGAVVAQNPTYVNHISLRDGAAVEVEIHTTATVASPDTQILSGPDRIVIDFPGALPAAALRGLQVNRGSLRAVRSGLFFSNPPITRVVLDLTRPQAYQIAPIAGGFVVKLTAAASNYAEAPAEPPAPRIGGARLTTVARVTESPVYHSGVEPRPAQTQPPVQAAVAPVAQPPKPPVTVSFQNGMLSIHAEKATLSQVLFEVQRQTQAEIAIPAGAEQEQVVTDLGPAPARDVLASLLNGSTYNFIFVGNEQDGSLGKVILTRRDSTF